MEKEIEKNDSIIDGHHPPDEFLVMQIYQSHGSYWVIIDIISLLIA